MAAGQFRFLTDSEYVLTLLTNRMRRGSRPVFLLGAGCSKQYGLPSFRELLLALWEDHLHYSGEDLGTEALRDGLEKLWQALGPKDRKEILASYLEGIRDTACPGYLQLATLASARRIGAIVNMNFDTLLEDALSYLGVNYKVSTSFRRQVEEGCLAVYKPHGTIGKLDEPADLRLSGWGTRTSNELILDIAKGDLFSDPEEERDAQELLTGADVVVLGYSGVDAKIVGALHHFRDQDPRNFKLFFVNPAPPDPRLLMPQEERGSKGLSIIGEAGGFESFMEELGKALKKPPGRRIAEEPPNENSAWGTWEASTRAEKAALEECIKLSQILGSGLMGQEMSDIDLEKHGLQVYFHCRELARCAGIRLTSPEKHVLQCAALLHDLGQLAIDRMEVGGDNPRWKLLEDHGQVTAAFIERRVPRGSALRESLVPSTYTGFREERAVETILGAILLLCRHHVADSPAPVEEIRDEKVFIDRWPVALRKWLLLPLFALAEEMVAAQPVPKNPDVYLDGPTLTENPAHNLSLRWRPGSLEISLRGRTVLCGPGAKVPLPIARWFKERILSFLERFNQAVYKAGGQRLEAESSAGFLVQGEEGSPLLASALGEALRNSAESVLPGRIDELPALLDLLAIYTLRIGDGEPWLQLNAEEIRTTLDRVVSFTQAPCRNLLQLYFLAQRREVRTSLEEAFVRGFKRIIYPAWRFVARQWRSRVSSIAMATSCLDMGTSRFRAEALEGIPDLLEEHVIRLPDGRAHAHDECTLCASRLLASFSNARLLFSEETLERFSPHPETGLDQAVAGLLRHFLAWPPDSPVWWGYGGEELSAGLRAPEYIAWSARALVTCLAADRAMHLRSGGSRGWLEDICGIERREVVRMLKERWKIFLAVQTEDLVSSRVEIVRTWGLGQVAGAYLELETCPTEIRDLALDGGRPNRLIESLDEVSTMLAAPIAVEQLVERLHLMTVDLVLDGERRNEQSAEKLVGVYLKGIASPAWIMKGRSAGSWGFEGRYTETILASLVAFWRHAFLTEHRDRFEAAFRESQSR